MSETTKKEVASDVVVSRSPLAFLLDFIKVSRPGWWIVTVWLYVAPIAKSSLDWFGLMYACLPLNALVYGLNDYADVDLDVTNERKGNLMFGPKGMTRTRLQKLLQTALLSTLVPLLLYATMKQQLLQYLVWYALVLVVNVAYNFKVLGHLSQNGPFEIPVVYFGFSLVTVLSYWLNTAQDTEVWGYQPSSTETMSTMKLFGCNSRYWIHLAFLVCRTQLWTEYMDYESDVLHKRGTTLARMPCKHVARLVVLFTLIVEAAWNWRQYQQVQEWQTLFLFSVLGVASFVVMEFLVPPKSSSFVWIALVQSMGGLWLIYDSNQKQVFVS